MEYDGADFAGWQFQPGRRTVQGVLETALAAALGARVPVVAAGRTDAGVHALGQVVSFIASTDLDAGTLRRALDARLPPDAALLSLEEAPAGFHATRDAVSKVYRYSVLAGRVRRPLLRRAAWRIPRPLDAARMRAAAALLLGRHDFRSFRTNPGPGAEGKGTVRTVHRIDVRRRGPLLVIEVEGDGFLYNMVRTMAGTLVEVGRGRWEPERAGEILAARDRAAAGPTAPPEGLVLVSVSYGEEGGGDGGRAAAGQKMGAAPPGPPRMGRSGGRRAPRRSREAKP